MAELADPSWGAHGSALHRDLLAASRFVSVENSSGQLGEEMRTLLFFSRAVQQFLGKILAMENRKELS